MPNCPDCRRWKVISLTLAVLVVVLCVLLGMGIRPPVGHVLPFVSVHPSAVEIRERVTAGMSPEQVRQEVGEPDQTVPLPDTGISDLGWLYKFSGGDVSVLFEHGRVVAVRQSI